MSGSRRSRRISPATLQTIFEEEEVASPNSEPPAQLEPLDEDTKPISTSIEPPSQPEPSEEDTNPSTPVETKVPGSPPPSPARIAEPVTPLSPVPRSPTSPLSSPCPDSPRSPFPRPSTVPSLHPPLSPSSFTSSESSTSSDVAVTGHESHIPQSSSSSPPSPSSSPTPRRRHNCKTSGYTAEMLVPRPFLPHESVEEVEAQIDQADRLGALIDAVEEWKRAAARVKVGLEIGHGNEVERFRMEALWQDVEARRKLV